MKTYKFILMSMGLCALASAGQAADLDLASVVQRAKQIKAKELADSLREQQAKAVEVKPAAPELVRPVIQRMPPPPPPPPPEPPVLRSLFGVDQYLSAEVFYNGKVVELNNTDATTGLGRWTNSYIFNDGVLLTIKPLSVAEAARVAPTLEGRTLRKSICVALKMDSKSCLFLAPERPMERNESVKADRGGIFQDQVRSLMSQPVPPINYTGQTAQR